jgi:hypothetical protein
MTESIPPAGGPELQASEALATLQHLAHKKTGRVPAELLARHVLRIYADAEWPVQRAALEAVLRRFDFARQDGLRVAGRPSGGSPFGLYRTGRRRGRARPYRTVLRGVEPLVASCACADFVRNSLGLCKHVLVILDDIAARPEGLTRAARASATSRAALRPNGGVCLVWDPVRPLEGPGDGLERIRLLAGHGSGAMARVRVRRALARFGRAGADGARLRSTWPAHRQRRLALVNDLLLLTGASRTPAREPDPGLEALLREERQRLDLAVGGASVPPGALRGLRRKLYPYQREGVARFLGSGRLLLADDMGLGKTVQAIAACHALYQAKRVERGLLIVPASLKTQWQREWEATSDVPLALVEGNPPQRAHAYRACARGFLVANYEQVLRDLAAILEWDPGLVVLDEAQRIKNWATKTATFVKRLRPPWRLVLTGTPMENRLEELASILDWVDDQALEPKWRLSPVHAVTADGSREVVGARHLDTLRARLEPSMLRRVRREVLEQLPPRTDTLVPVEMSDAQRGEHAALDIPIAALARRARQRPLTQAEFLRLMNLLTTQRIIANGMAQYRFVELWPGLERTRPSESLLASLSSPKLCELRALLSGLVLDQGRKVVVFSQWRRMLRLAAWATSDLFEAAGVRAAFFTGQEGQRQRTRNVVDFHDDPATRVLFASDAGGVGLNLQRAASACINCDLPWNPAVLEQRIGRIYRIGQTEPIQVYNLVSQDSIEARIAGLVSDKRALFTGLFDGDSDAVRFDRSGSFLTRLERLLGDVPAPESEDESEESEADAAEEAALDAVLEEADDPGPIEMAARTQPQPGRAPSSGEGEPAAPSAGGVQRLFASLEVRHTPEGKVRIEAPPEAAAALSALFEGMARMLREAGR